VLDPVLSDPVLSDPVLSDPVLDPSVPEDEPSVESLSADEFSAGDGSVDDVAVGVGGSVAGEGRLPGGVLVGVTAPAASEPDPPVASVGVDPSGIAARASAAARSCASGRQSVVV
jgi:hypothetical protein